MSCNLVQALQSLSLFLSRSLSFSHKHTHHLVPPACRTVTDWLLPRRLGFVDVRNRTGTPDHRGHWEDWCLLQPPPIFTSFLHFYRACVSQPCIISHLIYIWRWSFLVINSATRCPFLVTVPASPFLPLPAGLQTCFVCTNAENQPQYLEDLMES